MSIVRSRTLGLFVAAARVPVAALAVALLDARGHARRRAASSRTPSRPARRSRRRHRLDARGELRARSRPRACEQSRVANLMHDIGKVAIPDAILLSPDPLSEADFEVVKRHTEIAASW